MEISSDATAATGASRERRIRTPLMNQPLGLSKAFHDLTSHARGSVPLERRENDRSHVRNSSPITSIMHRVSTYYIMDLLMEKRGAERKELALGSIYHFSINTYKSNKRLARM